MEGFHRRYMVSNKVLRLWVAMARQLDIALIVPQHGAPIQGPAIGQLFDWLDQLLCGIDLMDHHHYALPRAPIAPIAPRPLLAA
jgi:flavorubredoxin